MVFRQGLLYTLLDNGFPLSSTGVRAGTKEPIRKSFRSSCPIEVGESSIQPNNRFSLKSLILNPLNQQNQMPAATHKNAVCRLTVDHSLAHRSLAAYLLILGRRERKNDGEIPL